MRKHSSKSRRKANKRPQKKTILIVCEGKETEPNYLNGFKRLDAVKEHYAIRIIKGQGGSQLQIARNAVKQNKKHGKDECWCVIDTERLNNPETVQDFNDAIKLLNDNGIEAAVSNPSFEVWLIAHFERTSRTFNDSDAAEAYLNTRFQNNFDRDYDKNLEELFDLLKDRVDNAIQNARNVLKHDHGEAAGVARCNSSTDVQEMIFKLKNKPEKKKKN